MIIKNGNVIVRINTLYYDELLNLTEKRINAIYKGKDLIWLTTYQIDIRSCYGSGNWLDSYDWIDDDTWKDNP